jgi:hypothetical protein
MFSGFRPGARTVSGNQSWHAVGRAVDLPPSMQIFNWIRETFGKNTKELIFTPAGGAQIKNGRPYTYTGAVAAQHNNHVHWAYDQGGLASGSGLWPKLTSKPERVLSPSQTQAFEQWMTGGGAGGNVTLVIDSSGSAVDDFLLEILRRSIRVRGGNVQTVIGRG